MNRLHLEVVTRDGVVLDRPDVDWIVVRRREPRFELGSEIAIYPLHSPLLVQLAVAPLRYAAGDDVLHVAVDGGFAEVLDDRVTIVAPRIASAPREADDAETAMAEVCRGWRGGNDNSKGDGKGNDES